MINPLSYQITFITKLKHYPSAEHTYHIQNTLSELSAINKALKTLNNELQGEEYVIEEIRTK